MQKPEEMHFDWRYSFGVYRNRKKVKHDMKLAACLSFAMAMTAAASAWAAEQCRFIEARAEREACYQDSAQLCHELSASGHYLGANPLHPTSLATSVRVRDGKPIVTDGPFAETREHLGGYFLIDAPNLDEAIRIAARIPGARKGTVEIRPVLEIPGLPVS